MASAAELLASRRMKIGAAMPVKCASKNPAGIARANESPVAIRLVLSALRKFGSRSGRCVPTRNMSMAKPTSERKDSVGSPVLMSLKPLVPRAIPAKISPTTRGRDRRRIPERSGPTRPATIIRARIPKVMGISFPKDEPVWLRARRSKARFCARAAEDRSMWVLTILLAATRYAACAPAPQILFDRPFFSRALQDGCFGFQTWDVVSEFRRYLGKGTERPPGHRPAQGCQCLLRERQTGARLFNR